MTAVPPVEVAEPVDKPDSPPAARSAIATAPVIAPVAAIVLAGWLRRWNFEDAFLNFRIVDHIRAGHGPVFNVGERVEVGTSVLWLWLLAGAKSLLPFAKLEWLAVLGGLVATGLGVWWAQAAAIRLWTRSQPRASAGIVVPFGAAAFVATPAAWDWATSGLENGLSLAWIGGSALLLARVATQRDTSRPRVLATAFVIGLGPLVRPDFALISLTLGIAFASLLLGQRRRRVSNLAIAFGAAILLPAAYELFRMGYYAAAVPNTALAKDSFGTYWADGWYYLGDFVGTYLLYLPVGLGLVAAVLAGRMRDRAPVVALVALPVAGVLHALYITRSGGDYLHARLLMPSLFAMLVPVAALPWRRVLAIPLALLAVWIVAASGFLRPGEQDSFMSRDPHQVTDGRTLMVAITRHGHHPVLATDFVPRDGITARRLQERGARAFVATSAFGWKPILDVTPKRTTLVSVTSGISGFLAGPDVRVNEAQGLADPISSRFAVNKRDSDAGHRKRESTTWIWALTTRPDIPLPGDLDPRSLAAARNALQCTTLNQIRWATTYKLTWHHWWADVTHAYGWSFVVVPQKPRAAERKFCTPPPGT